MQPGRRTVLIAVLVLAAMPAAARAAAAQSQPVLLTEPGAPSSVTLYIEPPTDDEVLVRLLVTSQRGCPSPVGFAMPMAIDGVALEKTVARFGQQPGADGSCFETLGTVFSRSEFAPLTRAERVEITLPWGSLVVPPAGLTYLRSFAGAAAPSTAAEAAPDPAADFEALSREVVRLAGQRRFQEAVAVADRAVQASEGRPIGERMTALINAGYVRRFAGDNAAAADTYRKAVAMAEEAGYESAELGVVLDNLSRLLVDAKDYQGAETLSLRAVRLLGQHLGPRHVSYGGALNNLALIYHARGNYEKAVEYSDLAVAALRVALAGNPAALRPFLDDNRAIKADAEKARKE